MCLSKFVCSSICLFVSFSVCLFVPLSLCLFVFLSLCVFVSLWFLCSSTAQHFLVIISGFCHEGPWIRIRIGKRSDPDPDSYFRKDLTQIRIQSELNNYCIMLKSTFGSGPGFFMVGSGLDFFLRVGSESDLTGSATLWCKGCYKRNWFVLWRVCLTQERGCTFRRGPFF